MSDPKPKYEVGYDNDVGPNDDYFDEWWTVVEDGRVIAKCDDRADAERIAEALEDVAALPHP